ncbi:hypothetical protein GCK72_023664 [Caenorhabditis remanei]|uniref:Uncharacterized protein n=1 Tax=Caenorhabditis remanei TaxID=31234 RepID=A0A6A5FXD4_CAERE|nr:hypothetical protein GCK72_023664 [Caenorhabditis remanei]KAF1747203.1 hypothetical protein GCK72_023664 [Caenorhabditis remanei]
MKSLSFKTSETKSSGSRNQKRIENDGNLQCGQYLRVCMEQPHIQYQFELGDASFRCQSSTTVQSRMSLTTIGILRSNSLAALMIPWAITSQRMIPPKMFTRMADTLSLSAVMILKASVTCSTVAPPPTSRKLAGSPPCNLIMSMVAMASPAPLTMHPMVPSRRM